MDLFIDVEEDEDELEENELVLEDWLIILCILVTTVPIIYATRILAAASIQEWRLFHSARPEVRRQFESGI